MVCKDSELTHPKDMQRDPFSSFGTFPGLRNTLALRAGTFTGFPDLELLPGPEWNMTGFAGLNFIFCG